ncbi:MAG: metal-dependent hydrolase [Candidatus Ranarchaeia archaeon]
MNRFEHKLWAVVTFLAIFFLWGQWETLETYPFIFWPSLLLVIVGSMFPDFDWDLGTKYHRSTFTHSPIIPGLIFFYYLVSPVIGFPTYIWVYEVMSWFSVGYATHLLLDIFPSNSGLIGMIITSFNPSHTPGDLRGVPERMERPFLIFSGIICILISIAGFLIGRGIISFPWMKFLQLSS